MNSKCLHRSGWWVVVALLGLCNLGQAQSITSDSIIWHVNSIFEINTGSITQVDETIVTYGDEQFVWLNRNGEIKKHFEITEIVGVWEDVNQPGSIVIRIAEGNVTGNLMIQRDAIKISIRLVYVEEGVPGVFDFMISHLEHMNHGN